MPSWIRIRNPDPDPLTRVESGSKLDPDADPDTDSQPCLKCRHSVHVHHQVRCERQLIVADVGGGMASTAVAVAVTVAVAVAAAADIRPAALG